MDTRPSWKIPKYFCDPAFLPLSVQNHRFTKIRRDLELLFKAFLLDGKRHPAPHRIHADLTDHITLPQIVPAVAGLIPIRIPGMYSEAEHQLFPLPELLY